MHPSLRLITRLSFLTLNIASSGCLPAEEEAFASFNLVVQDRTGAEYAVEGTDPSCKLNTSSPDSDPKRGKFFVGFFTSKNDNVVSLYVHFLDYTEPPPSGTYANGDASVDISFSTDFADDEVDVSRDERDLSSATVVLTENGDGLRLELGPNFPGASGYVQCAP